MNYLHISLLPSKARDALYSRVNFRCEGTYTNENLNDLVTLEELIIESLSSDIRIVTPVTEDTWQLELYGGLISKFKKGVYDLKSRYDNITL